MTDITKADWKLFRDGVITTDDLDGFSEDCRETVEQLLDRQWRAEK